MNAKEFPTLRLARAGELDALVRIDDAASELYVRAGLVLSLGADHPFVLAESARWARAIERGLAHVAVDESDEVLGFMTLGLVDGAPYLDQVSVHPRAMRRGIGAALMQQAFTYSGERPLWLTTYAHLARLEHSGITFIRLRRRSPALLAEIEGLAPSAWRRVRLDVPARKFKTPKVFEQPVTIAGTTFRQLFILDLGHEDPTILLTNDRHTSQAKLITRYAQRMLIENALSDAVRFFHMDALSSAIGLKVDFDMALLVIASGLYRLFARHMRGYADAQARHIFRDLIDTPADISVSKHEVHVHFHRRAHLPIIIASGILNATVKVPWWHNHTLRMTA